MAERLDALTVREYTDRDGNKKSSWTRIGAAFPTRDGGYSITLDALPLPTMGERGLETRIILKVPQDRSERQPQRNGGSETGSYGNLRDLDDEIPFAPEWR